ncbi:hypothetical protein NCS52_01119800 [Fusarium sp. LHS14.1]|nr:hypothetical protein NCS52_01119800 [Fusarium sp. LHS14.1]
MATMYGKWNGTWFDGSIDQLWAYVDKYGGAPDIQGRCDILDMTPTTAVVRISLENDASGGTYFDHHTLLKMKEKWEYQQDVPHVQCVGMMDIYHAI